MPKTIYLTFDDGPLSPWTEQILDLLERYNIKASFFLCGKNVEHWPEITKRIASQGHLIGNHTYSHSALNSFFGNFSDEIAKTQKIIFQTCGVTPKFFRPPWGWLAPWAKQIVKKLNLTTVLWDVWAYDWRVPDADWMAKRVVNKILANQSNDSVILLHDGNQANFQGDRSQTVIATEKIIIDLQAKGFQFARIDQLQKIPNSFIKAIQA